MKICFATNNAHKLQEIRELLGNEFEVMGLLDIGCREELPENQKTLEGNSMEKAEYVYQNYGVSCFADDTGLEVFALDGAPGVYSARYAGPQKNSNDNIALLLSELENADNRNAQFRTVITLIHLGKAKQFEGTVKGRIIEETRGSGGFGYDPIFVPSGQKLTFAEMDSGQKNKVSHRGNAIRKLVEFLKKSKRNL